MKLDEFVLQSITAVFSAIKTAQTASGIPISAGCNIVGQPPPPGFILHPNGGDLIPVIEFDIAVTVDNQAELKSGVAAALTVVGIGMQAKLKDSETSVSRIRFSIPVDIPGVSGPVRETGNS